MRPVSRVLGDGLRDCTTNISEGAMFSTIDTAEINDTYDVTLHLKKKG